MAAFEELGLLPQLGEAVSDLNWELPTAIQCDAIPAILGGGDVLIAAETGSGKTGAFSLPIAQIVFETRREMVEGGGPKKKKAVQTDGAWRLNIRDRDGGLAIGVNGLDCESRAPKAWHGARTDHGVKGKGKFYYEVRVVQDGLCRVGWSTEGATLNLGTDNESWGFGGTGKKSHGKRFDDYGESFTRGDILGCLLDTEQGTIAWSKNGRIFPTAFTLPRPLPFALFPAVLLQTSSLLCNFGASPLQHLPQGYVGVSAAHSSNIVARSAVTAVTTAPGGRKSPLAIILEPTYELVEQTLTNLIAFASRFEDPPIRCISVAGRGDVRQILAKIEEGCDAVVGTPARVCDLVESGAIPVDCTRFLVLDEADQMISTPQSQGQIERLLAKVPRVSFDGTRLQLIVCSATLHNFQIKQFADRYMHFPAWIDLKGMESVSETVHHVVCPVDAANDKQWIRIMHTDNKLEDDHVHMREEVRPGTATEETLSFGTKILKGIYLLKAIKALDMDKAIIFCRTKQQCDQMEQYLKLNGYEAACMHGDRSPEERKENLTRFRNGKIPFIICTDVAARGLDIAGVPFLINVTLPDDKAIYIHRVGRVGRAERMGLSISLVAAHPEKKGREELRARTCENRRDVAQRGCTIWYKEKQLLGEVEEHLGTTITAVDSDFTIPTDEIDGKVVYGTKRVQGASLEGFAYRLQTSVAQLADLERALQTSYHTITKI